MGTNESPFSSHPCPIILHRTLPKHNPLLYYMAH